MQLEEAYITEITKLIKYVNSTEDPLTQMVRMHQNNTNSAMVRTARSLKRELQRGTKTNKGQHSREDKRKMAGEKDAWTISTKLR
jgi:hypothetical protein